VGFSIKHSLENGRHKKAQQVKAPKKNGGRSANTNIDAVSGVIT